MKTIHDRLVEALIARGAERVPYKTKRYTVLAQPGGEPRLYFVGRAGALRSGRSITNSRPETVAFRGELLAASKGNVT
jgi:hypothetical protein